MMIRKYSYFVVSGICLLIVFTTILHAQSDLGRVLPAGKPLHIVAFGDFGSGNEHQRVTAEAMQKRNREAAFDLGITVGDNFYRCGVRGTGDKKWKLRWEDMYTPLGLPFYASLGNHDYGHPSIICPLFRGSPDAEVAYTGLSTSWRMPARYYTFIAGPVRFIAIDTEGWSTEQLGWIEKVLKDSQNEPGVRWRIVYGHHPMYSSGHHANERRIGALREAFVPLFQKYHVDLYIAGHDHGLERLEYEGLNLFITGGGGAHLRFMTHPKKESRFGVVVNGFLDLTIDETSLKAQFYDIQLKPLDDHPLVLTH
jgi:predicted MPP superfamily phosphohydrolase